MPRRKFTYPAKSQADIRRAIADYRSPELRRRERLQQHRDDLLRLRREGAPWRDLIEIISDAELPYSIAELRTFLEPLLALPPEAQPSSSPQVAAAGPARPPSPRLRPPPAPQTNIRTA